MTRLQQISFCFIQTENRHVMCYVEKAGFKPRTLGTGAERATNCASAPVNRLQHIQVSQTSAVVRKDNADT